MGVGQMVRSQRRFHHEKNVAKDPTTCLYPEIPPGPTQLTWRCRRLEPLQKLFHQNKHFTSNLVTFYFFSINSKGTGKVFVFHLVHIFTHDISRTFHSLIFWFVFLLLLLLHTFRRYQPEIRDYLSKWMFDFNL